MSKLLDEIKNLEVENKELKEKLLKKGIKIVKKEGIPFVIGRSYFMRTVTYHLLGVVVDVIGKFLVLEKASWVANSGRFNQFFENPDSSLENEPFGDRQVFVNIESIVDATERREIVTVM